MTQSIRDAAQALLDAAFNSRASGHTYESLIQQRSAEKALRAALSAPQPTADERVAELMRLVQAIADEAHDNGNGYGEGYWLTKQLAAVESSARALAAGREDAEHAAMYRWLVYQCTSGPLTIARVGTFELIPWSGDNPDAVIRAAMSARETE